MSLRSIGPTLLVLFATSYAAPAPTSITGVILGPDGYLVPGATVSVRESSASTLSDESGRFKLIGDFVGPITLVTTKAGFKASEKLIPAGTAGTTVVIEIRMQLAPVTQSIDVNGQGPLSVSPDHVTANILEILSTAGTDADTLKAVQMLPGVVKVDEGAGLYLEGGDVGEITTYINRALLPHPYRYETPTGGLFGSVDPFFIEGVSLNTAGFPARYGNALSGVLELNIMPKPEATSIFVNVGLASSSVDLAMLLGDHAGFRIAANRSFTSLLFAVNQPSQHFSQNPEGYDGSSAAYYDSKRFGSFTGYFYKAADKAGVEVAQGTFIGDLSASQANSLYSGSWEKPIGRGWKAQAVLSRSALDQTTHAGTEDIDNRENGVRAKVDMIGPLAGGTVRAGVDFEKLFYRIVGSVPEIATDLGGTQSVIRPLNERATERRFGTYLEYERTLGRFTLNLGGRSDAYRAAQTRDFDPRLSVQYGITKRQNLRFAWGIYHQGPSAFYLDDHFGNPSLGLMSAQHLVLGYTYGEESGNFFVRVSAYNKRYSGLPIQAPTVNFVNTGSGFGRGFDALVKARFGHNWDGWVGYSFLSARRRWTPLDDVGVFTTAPGLVPPAFAIPHTLQLVLHGRLPASFQVGATLRAASGKPFTPVLGGKINKRGHFDPVFGPVRSQQLPVYGRLDLNLSRPFKTAGKAAIMPYLGITNVLNRKNIFDYVYSPDYKQRSPGTGSLGRTFYVGMVFQR